MDDVLWTGTMPSMMIDYGRVLVAARLFHMFDQRSMRLPTGFLAQKRLQNAIDAMIANPERCFTLVDLARLCNSSVFHFSRSFTAAVGCAPVAFQRNLVCRKPVSCSLQQTFPLRRSAKWLGSRVRPAFGASSADTLASHHVNISV